MVLYSPDEAPQLHDKWEGFPSVIAMVLLALGALAASVSVAIWIAAPILRLH